MEEKKVSGTSGDSDSGATNDNSRGRSCGSDGRPRMDKLCTLLVPPLRQERDGTGARARAMSTFCVGEHAGYQTLLPRTVAGISQFAPGAPFVRVVDEGSVSSVSSCRSRGARDGCERSSL